MKKISADPSIFADFTQIEDADSRYEVKQFAQGQIFSQIKMLY